MRLIQDGQVMRWDATPGVFVPGDASLPQWITAAEFGAAGDGTTDDTAALQAAIDATPDNGILVLERNSVITSTLRINARTGLKFLGRLAFASAYGITAPKLIWGGSAHGHMLDMINSHSCLVEGIKFDMSGVTAANCAEIGINASRDDNISLTGVAIDIGVNPNTLTFTGAGTIVPTDSNGANLFIGRSISIPGAGVAGATLVTTITAIPDPSPPGTLTIATAASTTITGQTATIASPYTPGVSSSHTFRGLQLNYGSAPSGRAARAGIRIDYYSGTNGERMTIDDCAVYGNGPLTADDLDYGCAFQFGSSTDVGDAVSAGGSNLLNQVVTNSYWFGVSRGVKAACFVKASNNESNYTCIDYHGNGGFYILDHYSEAQRQLVKARGTVTLIACRPRYGAHDTSFAIAEMYGNGSLTCIDTPFYAGITETGQPSVLCTAGTASVKLVNCVMVDAALPDLSSFYGGIDEYSFGPRFYLTRTAFKPSTLTLAELSSLAMPTDDGVIFFVSDATPGTNPAVGSGTGALVVRVNGAWVAVSAASTPAQVSAVIYNNADITISGETTVTFNSEVQDASAVHSTASNTSRYVAPATGFYRFGFHAIELDSGGLAAAYCTVKFYVNGGLVYGQQEYFRSADLAFVEIGANVMLYLAANDYVEVTVTAGQVTSPVLKYYAGRSPYFTMEKVGL